MSSLHDTLRRRVDDGTVPGAVGLVARGDDVEVVAVGSVDVEGTAPMARDSIFRIASVSKPVTAAAVLALVEDGRLALTPRWRSGCRSWRSRWWSVRRPRRSTTWSRRSVRSRSRTC